MFCGSQTAVNHQHRHTVAAELRCKCWHCETCSEVNRRQVIARALNGEPDLFVTLTIRPDDFETPDAAARIMVRGLRELRRRIVREARRDPRKQPWPHVRSVDWSHRQNLHGRVPPLVRLHGQRFPFLSVFEAHESGWPHLHLLGRARWIDQEWLRAVWQELTGAFWIGVERPKNRHRAGAYVAKYLGKAPHRFDGCQRFWMSRDYEPDEAKAERQARKLSGPWWREDRPLAAVEAAFLADGWLVEPEGRRLVLWPP